MEWLRSALEYLRGANLSATAFRLLLAMLFGGIIGLEEVAAVVRQASALTYSSAWAPRLQCA